MPDPETITVSPTDAAPVIERFKQARAKQQGIAPVPPPPPEPPKPPAPTPAPEAPKPAAVAPAAASPAPASGPKAPEPDIPDFSAPPPPPPAPDPEPPKAPDAPLPPPSKRTKEDNIRALATAKDEIEAKYKAETAKARELETRLKELETKLATPPPPVPPPDYEAIKTEHAKYREIVEKVALEHDPRFKAAFDEKASKIIQRAKEAVGTDHAAKVESILQMPPGKYREDQIALLHDELESSFGRTKLVQAVTELTALQEERAAELGRASENRKKMAEAEAAAKAEQSQRSKAEREALADAALELASKVYPEFKETDDAEHNQQVRTIRDRVKRMASRDLSGDELARLAVYAERGKLFDRYQAYATTMIAKLQEQIKQLSGASPDLSGEARKPGAISVDKVDDVNDVIKKFRQGRPG